MKQLTKLNKKNGFRFIILVHHNLQADRYIRKHCSLQLNLFLQRNVFRKIQLSPCANNVLQKPLYHARFH